MSEEKRAELLHNIMGLIDEALGQIAAESKPVEPSEDVETFADQVRDMGTYNEDSPWLNKDEVARLVKMIAARDASRRAEALREVRDKIENLKKSCTVAYPSAYEAGMLDGFNDSLDAILADEPKDEGPCVVCTIIKGTTDCAHCGPPSWEGFSSGKNHAKRPAHE